VIVVFKAPLDEDLSDFTKQLWALNISHRVIFEQSQLLVVPDEKSAELVTLLYDHWQEKGEVPEQLLASLSDHQVIDSKRTNRARTIDFKKIPLVISLLLVSVLLSMAVDFGANIESLKYFTITDFELRGNSVNYFSLSHNFSSLELWRFISPIFIHFNIPHIIFNGLWIWVVGSIIEQRQGSVVLLFVTLFSGVSSNLAQYMVSGPIFGGLSGVVYAVIGYAWLWDKLRTDKLAVVSNALMGFMIAWLVLGYTGLLSELGLGNIANTAHLIGLICGLLAVPIMLLIKKSTTITGD